jgi:hypothetical protein
MLSAHWLMQGSQGGDETQIRSSVLACSQFSVNHEHLVVDVYSHTAERIPPYRPNRFATLDDIEEWLSERNKGAGAPRSWALAVPPEWTKPRRFLPAG